MDDCSVFLTVNALFDSDDRLRSERLVARLDKTKDFVVWYDCIIEGEKRGEAATLTISTDVCVEGSFRGGEVTLSAC